jgi:HAD superfamily hydrolase (TIGR01549 family)
MNARWVVLFDWDGTLIESLEIKIRNAAQLFQELLGMDPQSVAASYRQHSGIPRRDLFMAICAENGINKLDEDLYQRLSQRFSVKNLEALTDKTVTSLVLPDTTAALAELRKQGYPLYVSSSAVTEEIRLVARLWDLEKYFNEILGSATGFNKGSQHVDYVVRQQHVTHSQIVFVGDEPTDIHLGKAAGVFMIAKAGTYPPARLRDEGADRVITSLGELPEILNHNRLDE